jgi:hypothetical protein
MAMRGFARSIRSRRVLLQGLKLPKAQLEELRKRLGYLLYE